MAAYSSPTSRSAPEYPPAYPIVGAQSPMKARAQAICQQFAGTGTCANGDACPMSHGRHDSPHQMRPQLSPTGRDGPRMSPHHQRPYQGQPAHHSHPNPPSYGLPPPPPYEGGPGGMPLPPPPPPSYEQHIMAVGSQHASRHASPTIRSPDYAQGGSPHTSPPRTHHHADGQVGEGGPPAYNARYRHDPYSPNGSRVVSPNRRD